MKGPSVDRCDEPGPCMSCSGMPHTMASNRGEPCSWKATASIGARSPSTWSAGNRCGARQYALAPDRLGPGAPGRRRWSPSWRAQHIPRAMRRSSAPPGPRTEPGRGIRLRVGARQVCRDPHPRKLAGSPRASNSPETSSIVTWRRSGPSSSAQVRGIATVGWKRPRSE